tara:strand:- start:198 stop:1802 length:1605 start_codon:yes stop_codon:yes gene_type:complete
MGAEALRRGYQASGVGGALTDYTYFSFLGSPDTILRGNFGAVGGAIQAALEKVGEGVVRGNWEEAAKGGRILKSLAMEGPGIYKRAMQANPVEFQKMYRQYMPKDLARVTREGVPEQYTGGVGVGRFFSAPDMAAVNAMRRGGFSAEDAARYTLTGTPQTKVFQSGLRHLQQFKGASGAAQFIGTQLAPFARVGLLGLEKGLQRTPVVGIAANKLMKTGATPVQQLVQQGLGTGAGFLGYKSDDLGLDPRAGLVLGPLAGPAFLPFQAGREFRRQRERGRPSALGLAGELIKESSPLGFQPAALFYNPQSEIPRRLVPAGVADIAEALDPAFGRERGRATLEQAAQRGGYEGPTDPLMAGMLARLPDVRQQLPETFAPVDVFGRPRYETPQVLNQGPVMQGLSRTVFPSRESAAPPAMNQLDPLMAQLAELGITPGPPSARVTLPGTGLPLQQTAESAAATQRVGGIPPQIAAQIVAQIMSRPQMQALPDAQRNWIARQLMDRIRGRVGRALGSARLATALGSGAQLPSLLRQP